MEASTVKYLSIASVVWFITLFICILAALYVLGFILCVVWLPMGLTWRRVERDRQDGIEC